MTGGQTRTDGDEFEALRERLMAWRERQKPGEHIPEEIWKPAVVLARQHGVSRASMALRLGFRELKARVEARGARRKARRKETERFAELSCGAGPLGPPECVIEVEGSGTRILIALNGRGTSEVASVIEALASRVRPSVRQAGIAHAVRDGPQATGAEGRRADGTARYTVDAAAGDPSRRAHAGEEEGVQGGGEVLPVEDPPAEGRPRRRCQVNHPVRSKGHQHAEDLPAAKHEGVDVELEANPTRRKSPHGSPGASGRAETQSSRLASQSAKRRPYPGVRSRRTAGATKSSRVRYAIPARSSCQQAIGPSRRSHPRAWARRQERPRPGTRSSSGLAKRRPFRGLIPPGRGRRHDAGPTRGPCRPSRSA